MGVSGTSTSWSEQPSAPRTCRALTVISAHEEIEKVMREKPDFYKSAVTPLSFGFDANQYAQLCVLFMVPLLKLTPVASGSDRLPKKARACVCSAFIDTTFHPRALTRKSPSPRCCTVKVLLTLRSRYEKTRQTCLDCARRVLRWRAQSRTADRALDRFWAQVYATLAATVILVIYIQYAGEDEVKEIESLIQSGIQQLQ